MQVSENTVVSVGLFFILQTGGLLWFLATINGKVNSLVRLATRVRKIELRCARIHGAVSEGERDENGE